MKIPAWLQKRTEPLEAIANIRLIGDRSSGKTAYMAALAYWPNADPASPVQSVTPTGDRAAGEQLIRIARNILAEGLKLDPTDLDPQILRQDRDYQLTIRLKEQFSWQNPDAAVRSVLLDLTVGCKDYSGEFFRDLIHKSGDLLLSDYLQDCLKTTGILLLVDGTAHWKDEQYARGLEKFLGFLKPTVPGQSTRRLAFALSKCEQPQLWVDRHRPKHLADALFPLMQDKLARWTATGSGQVEYFSTSAFGMTIGDFPDANATLQKRDLDGTICVLKDAKSWRPFGLVSPVYWLCTGQRHPQLDKD